MDGRKVKLLLISDFNVGVLSGYLNNDEDQPVVHAEAAPFGQVMPILLDMGHKRQGGAYDAAVVWSRPEGVIGTFNNILSGEKISKDVIYAEVDDYSQRLADMGEKMNMIFVPMWVNPSYYRDYGIFDVKNGANIENILMRMNLRLADNLQKVPNIYLLNTQRWIGLAGKNASNPKLWYMGKIPFSNEVFSEAAKDIRSALSGIAGQSRKLIILDLDDTVWGGITGEIGWQNINLGGHDPLGEAYVDFQRTLKALNTRGILLGIVSKNDEEVALETIKSHPEMVLKLKDFAGWRINWKDKAENIIDLVSGLNMGLQSVVFIDDNPAERSRVREALPDVLVPELPDDKMLLKKSLLSLRCFDVPSLSTEDGERTEMYAADKQRQGLKYKASSLDDWLKSLKIKVTVGGLNEANLQRAAQLLNKTNQMNLATRRLTEKELMDWVKREGRKLWTFRVEDRFGDSGLTGIASLEWHDGIGNVVDFVLSCRVIGRRVEETMLYTVIEYARSIGLKWVSAVFVPTPKNKPCLEFWKRSGFVSEGKSAFKWKVDTPYPVQKCIEIAKGPSRTEMVC